MRKHTAWTFLGVTVLCFSAVHAQGSQKRTLPATPTVPAVQPQASPTPSKPTSKASTRQSTFGPVQSGPQGTSPQASTAHNAVLVSLRKQRQAADAEAAQMKLGIRPAAKPGASAAVAKTGTVQKGGPGTLGPEKTMGAEGVSHQNAGQFVGPAVICAQDPTMRILTVSGESSPATFTTDAATNFYTITGCSFGDPGANAKVYIYYQGTFRLDFTNIVQWTDNGIQLSLDSTLTGISDHDNLTLVVQRADGKQATKSGFKFYAARETRHLRYFPRDQFALWTFTTNDISHLSPQYESPSQVSTYSANVTWQCNNCSAKKGAFSNVYMQGNEDVWHLGKLQPGFVVENWGLGYRDLQCGGSATLQREGTWGIKMVGSDIHAQWQGQTCVDQGCGGFGQPDCFAESGSSYFMNIIVTGPRGVDPWSGKPSNN
jgi:hypothetical protein